MSDLILQAHTHARNAVFETRKSNPVAASEEHDLAAGEFATAALNSSDKEVSLVPLSIECGLTTSPRTRLSAPSSSLRIITSSWRKS